MQGDRVPPEVGELVSDRPCDVAKLEKEKKCIQQQKPVQRHILGESTYLKFSRRWPLSSAESGQSSEWCTQAISWAGWGGVRGWGSHRLFPKYKSIMHTLENHAFHYVSVTPPLRLGGKETNDTPRQDNLSSLPYLRLGFIPSQRISCDNTAAQEALKGSFKSCTPSHISLSEQKRYLSKHEKQPLALGERKRELVRRRNETVKCSLVLFIFKPSNFRRLRSV